MDFINDGKESLMHDFSQILHQIDALLGEKDTVLVAIDGPCTAGKTTLAAYLAQTYSCNVFHMDEFFLQSFQRTPERLAEPGGNVDYQRFSQEILLPLTRGETVCYRPYDCSTQSLKAPITVPHRKLSIIEGTYSCHPCFGDVYDLRIYLTVSPEIQRQRVLQRPAFKHQRFFTEWIPREQQYFEAFQIRKSCGIVCSTQEAL